MGVLSTDILLNGFSHGWSDLAWWGMGMGMGMGVYLSARFRLNAQRAKPLVDDESRYRRLYEETPAMMHSIDHQGCIVSVNSYWLEKLGYSREEVIGKPLLYFVASSFQSKVSDILSDLEVNTLRRDKLCQFVKKSGEPMDVLLSTMADCDSKTCSGSSFGVLVDITERKKAKEKPDFTTNEVLH